MDQGKLFVGGISWDTNEDRLNEYFGAYGEVIESVIMRDRATGRARGFGFIVFADPAVAERVIREKHMIDGRSVEAKKAVPRDDQHLMNRINGILPGSPAAGRTKKIFVGGLPSALTENDFKEYFEQFGIITDVVVMYDHNTERPRGFGFITYDSEDAVDRVLHKTFHELNGKMVEVKRAVPKELSPGPSRSPLTGYNYGLSRSNNFLSNLPQGYNNIIGSIGSYGVRVDGRNSPLSSACLGLSPFGSAFGMGVNMDQGLNASFGGSANFSSNLSFGRVMSSCISNNQGRYTSPIGYNTVGSRNVSSINESPRSEWGNGGLSTSPNTSVSNSYFSSGSSSFRVFENSASNWGASPIVPSHGLNFSGYSSGNFSSGSRENSYVMGAVGFGRNSGTGGGAAASSFVNVNRGHETPYGDFHHGGSIFEDRSWHSLSPDLGVSASFDRYGFRNSDDAAADMPEDYALGYDVTNMQSSRGVAA